MRYENVNTFFLPKNARYNKILEKRGIRRGVQIMATPVFNSVMSLDFNIIRETEEIWSTETKLWKLASRHYGDGSLYWVIGCYNLKPTDAHWKIGDIVFIPHPHEYVAETLRG